MLCLDFNTWCSVTLFMLGIWSRTASGTSIFDDGVRFKLQYSVAAVTVMVLLKYDLVEGFIVDVQ